MRKRFKINPVVRAVGVFTAVAALVTGVTFAQFNRTATLEDNTLSSATAGLLVDGSDRNSTPTQRERGFRFDNLSPGRESRRHTFRLRNSGDTPLNVSVHATRSDVDGQINNNRIRFCFVHVDSSAQRCYTRQQMLSNYNRLPGNPLGTNDTDTYRVYVRVDDNHGGRGFRVDGFDLVFSGSGNDNRNRNDDDNDDRDRNRDDRRDRDDDRDNGRGGRGRDDDDHDRRDRDDNDDDSHRGNNGRRNNRNNDNDRNDR